MQRAQARHPIHDRHGRQRAHESEQVDEAKAKQRDLDRDEQPNGRAKGRAARRAKNIGIGKRVAQQALVGGSGERQRGAHGHRRQDSREAQLEHDRLGTLRATSRRRPVEQAMTDDRDRVRDGDRDHAERHTSDERATARTPAR